MTLGIWTTILRVLYTCPWRPARLVTLPEVAGDNNGLRLGVPEIVRLGMDSGDMPKLAGVIVRALTGEPEPVAAEVAAFRRRFSGLHYML